MTFNCLCHWTLGIGLSLGWMTSLSQAGHPYDAHQAHHFHHPYQDRFPSGSIGNPISSAANPTERGSGATTCGAGGSGNCPVSTTAALTLWVCDDATVCINGQTTKPQTLAGVHSGSRIYNLAGLNNGPLTASITVQLHRADGTTENGETTLTVEAGGKYEVKYPQAFMVEFLPAQFGSPSDEIPLIQGTVGGSVLNKPAANPESPEPVASRPADNSKPPVTESEKKEPEDRPEPSGTRRGFKPALPDSVVPANEGKLPPQNPVVEPAKASDAAFVPSPSDPNQATVPADPQ